jgi:hypothetical protein
MDWGDDGISVACAVAATADEEHKQNPPLSNTIFIQRADTKARGWLTWLAEDLRQVQIFSEVEGIVIP